MNQNRQLMWDRELGRFVPISTDSYDYAQQYQTTSTQPYERYPGYGVPQPGPVLAPSDLYSQYDPQQAPHPFTPFPRQPGAPAAGQTGCFPQQYGQNSLLGMPSDLTSSVSSNLNFNQNQQRKKGMRKGSGHRRENWQDVEKDVHRDNKLDGNNRKMGDHIGRGIGHRRGRGRFERSGGNTDEKDSEVDSECGNEENDDNEEDNSESEDTDTDITEKSKSKRQEFFKTATISSRKERSPRKKNMQDSGNQTDREPTEPPEETKVFEYLIKEVGGPISLKNIAEKKLFPKEFDIPSWFRSHQRQFIMFENKEKTYQFIVPFYREATFCLDYNRLRRQERCDQSDCPHAHICKDFISGYCKEGQQCPFSHNFYDRANADLISKLGLDIFSNEEIRLIYNQRFPHVCGKHSPSRICRLSACAYLHICKNNLLGRCENGSDCKLSHTFETEQNKTVLKAYQLSHWKESLLKKVIFMYVSTSKAKTHPKDISRYGSEESIPEKRNMSQNRLIRGAYSTSNLQNEQLLVQMVDATNSYAYAQQYQTTSTQPCERYPEYGVPQPGPVLAPRGPYSQYAPQQALHTFTQFPSQPGILAAGQTGYFPQQYGQNSLLGMPSDLTSSVSSNLNFNQNQQREKGIRKGSGERRGNWQDVEKDGHRDNTSSGKNKIGGDHRGRGRGHMRRRGRFGKRGGNTNDKDSEIDSVCENEENDDNEEDYSESEDTDTDITEKSKSKSQEFFKTSTVSLRKEKTSRKKNMQDSGNQTHREPYEPPEENKVFEYLIKEVGGPISLKNIAEKKLFPKEFDIPSWFRSHQRQFIMFENKEKTYQFIVPFYREATFCLDYNRLRRQERCDQSDCPHAHICKYFVSGYCKEGQQCPFSHNFYDRANADLISKLGLDIFSNEEIRLIYNQRFPHVCGKHSPSRICRLSACAYLHICKNNLLGRCENGSDCKLGHTFETEQNKTVLKAYQLAHWKESLLKKVIFMYVSTSKAKTHPNDISRYFSEESIPEKRNMSVNILSIGAYSTSNLQNEQKSKSQSRSKSSDVKKGHRRSSTSPSHERLGKDSAGKNQMNSRNEEIKPSPRKKDLSEEGITREDELVGRTGSLEPKSVNTDTDVGGVKSKGPRPRHRMNNGDSASTDSVLGMDAAQSSAICDLYLVDSCKKTSCKCHHHDSIKLPYIWQIQMFNSWMTLEKLKMIEAENAYCNKRSTIQTTIFYGGRNYIATLELDTLTAVVTDGGSSSFTIHTSARRLSTESYAEGSNPSAEESFKTQWRWFYRDESGSFCLLEPELLQFTLEQKFVRKCQDTYLFCRENYKFRYRIDFKSMEQINMETGEGQKLFRRPLFVSAEDVETKHYPEKIVIPTGVQVPLPNAWVPWDLAHAFELVELKRSSPEFSKVECSFLTTLNPKEFHIRFIYRVQNMELWMAYDGQKKSMKVSLKRAGQTKEVDERNLFHGTDSLDNVQGICTNSFDFRLCGKHGTLLGKGAYFARDAKYSHSYTNNSNATAVRYMFLAKVLIGEYTNGSSSYLRPPEKPGGTAHQLFDSCVDNVDNPALFVVFDLKQCYPEYLICYKNLEEFPMEEATSVRSNENTRPFRVIRIQP